MSLVEQAIKKMQAARSSVSAEQRSSAGVVGVVVDADGVSSGLTERRIAHRTDKIVQVDRNALRGEGLIPPEHQQRVLADQYRHIKRQLIAAITGRGGDRVERGQFIMVTSAMPGEGKTFTSINLALSMALEKDFSVLLVDADVLKPHISRIFGVEKEPGLMDLLRDEHVPLASTLLQTDVPNLSILPAGKMTETASELLASRRMGLLMQELEAGDARRIVVIDSPPVLLTSEARALAHVGGQIVLVVGAGLTPQRAVLDAIDALGNDRPIGLVLNRAAVSSTPGYYYGYGYGDDRSA